MLAFSIASKEEWKRTKEIYKIKEDDLNVSPFGEYFFTTINNSKCLFYRSMVRKILSAASTQWMVDHFNITHIIVIGTCAGVNINHQELDIFQFKRAYQCDVMVYELTNQLCKGEIELYCFNKLSHLKSGKISTQDKTLVLTKDAEMLRNENIDCDDMESAAVATVCSINNIPCTVIKGISDFANGIENFCIQSDKYEINTNIIMDKICNDILPIIIE